MPTVRPGKTDKTRFTVSTPPHGKTDETRSPMSTVQPGKTDKTIPPMDTAETGKSMETVKTIPPGTRQSLHPSNTTGPDQTPRPGEKTSSQEHKTSKEAPRMKTTGRHAGIKTTENKGETLFPLDNGTAIRPIRPMFPGQERPQSTATRKGYVLNFNY